MRLEGLHHLTMITGDARKNVEFYADVLGLRLVKKTVNFDQPEAYRYFGDETGGAGSILTRFEKMHAHLREQFERTLTPLVNPRTARREPVTA